MPKLLGFLVLHAGVGLVLALLAVAALLAFDVAGLRGLTERSEFGALAIALLVVKLAGALGAAQIGIALALAPTGSDEDLPPRD